MKLNEYLEMLDGDWVAAKLKSQTVYPNIIPLIQKDTGKFYLLSWKGTSNFEMWLSEYHYEGRGPFLSKKLSDNDDGWVAEYEFIDPTEDPSVQAIKRVLTELGFKLSPVKWNTLCFGVDIPPLVEFTARRKGVKVKASSFLYFNTCPYVTELEIEINNKVFKTLRVYYSFFNDVEKEMRRFTGVLTAAINLRDVTVECMGEQIEVSADLQRKIMSNSVYFNERIFMYLGKSWMFLLTEVGQNTNELDPVWVNTHGVKLPNVDILVIPILPCCSGKVPVFLRQEKIRFIE